MMARKSKAGIFLALSVASIAAHGLVLSLPVPEKPAPDSSFVPPASDEGAVIDVAILPAGTDDPAGPETGPEATEDTVTTDSPAIAPAPESSTQPEEPPALPPEPREAPPPQAPEPKEEPRPLDHEPTSPLDDVPIASGNGELTPTDPTPAELLAQALQDRNAYQYDGRKSLSFSEVTSQQLNWNAAGQVLPAKVTPMDLPYQLADECLDVRPAMGLLMAVVDADNRFVRGPEVISSTGYDVLDRQAIAMVTEGDYTFPQRQQPTAYSVEIRIQYPTACP